MKVLHINCHPDLESLRSATNQLSLSGLQSLRDKNADTKVLNLYQSDCFIPGVDRDMLSMWKNKSGEYTEIEQKIHNRQEELLSDWLSADYIFIYSPLYNFNIPSKLKDYLDNILIPKRTFNYTVDGAVGMLGDSKHIIYIQCSGSDYRKNFKYLSHDITPYYISAAMDFIGLSKLKVIRAQGLDIKTNDRDKIISHAKIKLADYIAAMK